MAALARSQLVAPETQRLVFNQLAIDPVRREVTLNDEPIVLTALEFDLLHFLPATPVGFGVAGSYSAFRVSRYRSPTSQEKSGISPHSLYFIRLQAAVIHKVWESDYIGDQRVVDVHIGQIRKKIEIDPTQPKLFHTVCGGGFKLELPNTTHQNTKF